MAIFGNTANGVNQIANLENVVCYCGFTTGSSPGTGISITAWIDSDAKDHAVKAALYKSDRTPVTNGTTNAGTAAKNTEGWITLNFTVAPSITANTFYYIAIWADAPAGGAAYIDGTTTANSCYTDNETYGTWPATLAIDSTIANNSQSIYCTYTEIKGRMTTFITPIFQLGNIRWPLNSGQYNIESGMRAFSNNPTTWRWGTIVSSSSYFYPSGIKNGGTWIWVSGSYMGSGYG